jgi:hypothetical protein
MTGSVGKDIILVSKLPGWTNRGSKNQSWVNGLGEENVLYKIFGER